MHHLVLGSGDTELEWYAYSAHLFLVAEVERGEMPECE